MRTSTREVQYKMVALLIMHTQKWDHVLIVLSNIKCTSKATHGHMINRRLWDFIDYLGHRAEGRTTLPFCRYLIF